MEHMAMTIEQVEKMHRAEHYQEVVRQAQEHAQQVAHDELVWELRNGDN